MFPFMYFLIIGVKDIAADCKKSPVRFKKRGYKNCYLWVLEENKQARKFYKKHGFHCNRDGYKLDVRYVIEL